MNTSHSSVSLVHYTNDRETHEAPLSSREDFIHRQSKVPLKCAAEESMEEYRKVVAPFAGIRSPGQNEAKARMVEATKRALEAKFKGVYESPGRVIPRPAIYRQPEVEEVEQPRIMEPVDVVQPKVEPEPESEPAAAEEVPKEVPRRPSSSKAVLSPHNMNINHFVASTPADKRESAEKQTSRSRYQVGMETEGSTLCGRCANRQMLLEQARGRTDCGHEKERAQLERLRHELERNVSAASARSTQQKYFNTTARATPAHPGRCQYRRFIMLFGVDPEESPKSPHAPSLTTALEWSTAEREHSPRSRNANVFVTTCSTGFCAKDRRKSTSARTNCISLRPKSAVEYRT